MYKHTTLRTFSMLLLTLLLFSCSNDDDGSTNGTNQFSYDGKDYTITSGFLTKHGSNGNGSYDWDITLLTNNLTQTSTSGTGEMIFLDLNTDSSAGLTEGTYLFSNERSEFTFIAGSITTNLNVAEASGNAIAITGGSVEIEKRANFTEVRFDLSLSDGNTSTGHFKGIL